MIIAVDGIDCSGKSTVLTLLRDYLTIDRKYADEAKKPCVFHVNHPGSTEIGKELRRIVKDPKFKPTPIVERLIFAADLAQFEAEYAELASAGAIILCDRYSRITDFVYGMAAGLPLDRIEALQATVNATLKADFYFACQCSVDTALERKEGRDQATAKTGFGAAAVTQKCRIEEQGREHAKRVADAYNSLRPYDSLSAYVDKYNATPSRLQALVNKRAERVYCVDAEKSVKESLQSIIAILDPFLPAEK